MLTWCLSTHQGYRGARLPWHRAVGAMLMWNALAVRKGKRNAVIDEFFKRTVGESQLVGAVAFPAHLGRRESHLVGGRTRRP